jgi:hypothetical protein
VERAKSAVLAIVAASLAVAFVWPERVAQGGGGGGGTGVTTVQGLTNGTPVAVVFDSNSNPSQPFPVAGTVNVGNPATSPVPVAVQSPVLTRFADARTPFRKQVFIGLLANTMSATPVTFVPDPANTVVIEAISLETLVLTGQNPWITFQVYTIPSAGGSKTDLTTHYIPLTSSPWSANQVLFIGAQSTRIYVPAGYTVEVDYAMDVSVGLTEPNSTVTFTGYSVPAGGSLGQ